MVIYCTGEFMVNKMRDQFFKIDTNRNTLAKKLSVCVSACVLVYML